MEKGKFRHSTVQVNTYYQLRRWMMIKLRPRKRKMKTEIRLRRQMMNKIHQLTRMAETKFRQARHQSITEDLPTICTQRSALLTTLIISPSPQKEITRLSLVLDCIPRIRTYFSLTLAMDLPYSERASLNPAGCRRSASATAHD